jgi:hypothetical protein
VHRDYAGFGGKKGELGRPITLDGHGATLEGSDPMPWACPWEPHVHRYGRSAERLWQPSAYGVLEWAKIAAYARGWEHEAAV